MPSELWFYHAERQPPDAVLVSVLNRVLDRGWRALVCAEDRPRAEHLNGYLWTYDPDSFLPHGLWGCEDQARMPVIVAWPEADLPTNPNAAHVLISFAAGRLDDLPDLARRILIFDGGQEAALKAARAAWVREKALGAPMSYWRQDPNGGWKKQD